jgi:D-amino-acid dehydrogenase
MKKDIIIVGGGIVGLMTAYSLLKSGRSVTVIDRTDINDSASFGNAGLLSAFKKSPLSAPGVISETLKLMLKGESPVNIHPSIEPDLYRWLLKFASSATEAKAHKTMALFERYGRISMDIYQEMNSSDDIDFYFKRDGLLMVYTEGDSYEEALKRCNNDQAFEILSSEQTMQLIPTLNERISGSVLLKENGHLDPAELMAKLKEYLDGNGVEFLLNEEVSGFGFDNDKISMIYTSKGDYQANTLILATGADDSLARQTHTKYLMTPAKGYSITFGMNESLKPKVPALFADLFIAMTPRRHDIRITSKLELGAKNLNIPRKQIDSIVRNFTHYNIEFEMKSPVEWTGFRPLTPNDIPIIGYDKKYTNLVHANGLGWLGITLGPAIGKIISDLVNNDGKNELDTDILLFSAFYNT